jgi:hypothetical protein
MTRLLFLTFTIGHLILVAAYWFLSGDAIGTVLLLIFGVAVLLMGWMLGPTVSDVGPTAPVDPDWHETKG